MAWMPLARAPQPAATAAVIEDKTYTVTPAAMKVNAGFVTGEVTEVKARSTSSCPSAAASERRPPRGDKHGRFHHDPGFPGHRRRDGRTGDGLPPDGVRLDVRRPRRHGGGGVYGRGFTGHHADHCVESNPLRWRPHRRAGTGVLPLSARTESDRECRHDALSGLLRLEWGHAVGPVAGIHRE